MADFETPVFLQNHSPEEVFASMKSIIPKDLDLSAGGHAYNLTMPTALVVAELCEFVLPEVIKIIFPQWSYGTFLDGHSKSRNLVRREATAASGDVTITGTAGTVIPAGSLFSTAAINDEPSVDYVAVESATIPAEGSVTITIECTQTGIIGNTPADTIILAASKITGITSVTNPEAITGGTEEETDESLRARIEEYDHSLGDSYTGNVSDYKRWATSVDGVGKATIIPAQDDSGLVTIILTDANGDPATQILCEEVYNYIMRPDAPAERKAPVGAMLSVAPPDTIEIGIKATVELTEDASIESVKTAYMAKLASYLPVAFEEGEIKYTRVAAALASTEGANDFADLQIGIKSGDSVTYGTANIIITASQLPAISENDLILTAGTV